MQWKGCEVTRETWAAHSPKGELALRIAEAIAAERFVATARTWGHLYRSRSNGAGWPGRPQTPLGWHAGLKLVPAANLDPFPDEETLRVCRLAATG